VASKSQDGGTVDAAEEKAGMTIDSAKLTQEGDALHATTGPATTYWMNDAPASRDYAVKATFNGKRTPTPSGD
jgi:hypothetical protein